MNGITRRRFFENCGIGLGRIALGSLVAGGSARSLLAGGRTRPPHFRPKAKRVVYLFMAGGPSQLDLFDNKPELIERDGQAIPKSVVGDQRYAFINPTSKMLAPQYRFRRHGESGAEISEVLPHLAGIADRIAIVKSMTTDQFNHAPAQILMNTGFPQPGRPSMGSWASYGLGCEADDLPAFVVLSTGGGPSGGTALWHHGFLPGRHQGVVLRSRGDAILDLGNPPGVDDRLQRDSLDLVSELNTGHFARVGDPEIQTRIAAYEMAYRMQERGPELMDLSGESPATLQLYGVDPDKPSFARNCLLARRLLERGVRFVQLYHKGWDHHSAVKQGLKTQCGITDRAAAALVTDLQDRGLLDDTLVIWGGEFGRTPMVENSPTLGRKLGRDHHPQAFTVWLAGAGIKPGITIGATDELGFHVVEDPVHVHDLQATILYLLGFDHERLTFRFQGRDFRLTDVHGKVVRKLLA